MRYRVLPYKQGSKSARALADALGGKVLKLEGSKFRPKADDIIINWGNTGQHPVMQYPVGRWWNASGFIQQASNKLLFFNLMKEKGLEDIIPPFWTDIKDIPDEPGTYPVVCRTALASHSGAGIVIAAGRDDLVPCRLITKYIKKKDEYRVHGGLCGGAFKAISLQRKARNPNHENPNWQVRNHNNGFIFVRGDVAPPACVLDVAERCLRASGLDFGAIDVIYNEHERKAYCLEINTAPGLEGQTVEDYANYFKGV